MTGSGKGPYKSEMKPIPNIRRIMKTVEVVEEGDCGDGRYCGGKGKASLGKKFCSLCVSGQREREEGAKGYFI